MKYRSRKLTIFWQCEKNGSQNNPRQTLLNHQPTKNNTNEARSSVEETEQKAQTTEWHMKKMKNGNKSPVTLTTDDDTNPSERDSQASAPFFNVPLFSEESPLSDVLKGFTLIERYRIAAYTNGKPPSTYDPRLCYCSPFYNRSNPNLDIRGNFETLLSDAIAEFKRTEQTEPLYIAIIGAGHLGEVMILAELLKHHGIKSAHIDCIDKDYADPSFWQKFNLLSNQQSTRVYYTNIHFRLKMHLHHRSTKLVPSNHMRHGPASTRDLNRIIFNFSILNPDRTTTNHELTLHQAYFSSVEDYVQHLTQTPNHQPPSIICAIDVVDDDPSKNFSALIRPLKDFLAIKNQPAKIIAAYSPFGHKSGIVLTQDNLSELEANGTARPAFVPHYQQLFRGSFSAASNNTIENPVNILLLDQRIKNITDTSTGDNDVITHPSP